MGSYSERVASKSDQILDQDALDGPSEAED
jgi:hypothetical protein